MSTPVHPAQLVTQRIEDAMCLPIAERFPQEPATTADQKRHICSRCHMPCAGLAIFSQCDDCGRVDRQQSRFGILGLPDRQKPTFQVDIGVTQVQCFRDAQADRGHQAKQGFVGGGTNAARRSKLPGSRQQVDDFLVMEDVGREASPFRTKGQFLRYFGLRLELLEVARKQANLRETHRPSRRW